MDECKDKLKGLITALQSKFNSVELKSSPNFKFFGEIADVIGNITTDDQFKEIFNIFCAACLENVPKSKLNLGNELLNYLNSSHNFNEPFYQVIIEMCGLPAAGKIKRASLQEEPGEMLMTEIEAKSPSKPQSYSAFFVKKASGFDELQKDLDALKRKMGAASKHYLA